MKPLIEFRCVNKAFDGRAVLSELNLSIAPVQATFIIGASGAGKSVAIKHLVGLLPIDSGELWFDNARIDQLTESSWPPIRRRIGMVFQHATLFDAMTLAENVALPLRKHQGLSYRAAVDDARGRLSQVGLFELANRYPGELSDGVRKRAAIARTLAMEPEVMLFDEPTTGLDPPNARRIDALIRDLVDTRAMTAVVVSHDLVSISNTADQVAFLYQGKVHALGTPAELEASGDPVLRQFLAGQASGPMETPGF